MHFLLESLERFTDPFTDLWKFAGPENNQDDHQYYNELGKSHCAEHGRSSSSDQSVKPQHANHDYLHDICRHRWLSRIPSATRIRGTVYACGIWIGTTSL